MIDSLSPFQVPRRSGIALSAAAGAAASVASTAIQASFDMSELLQALIASLFPVQSPYWTRRFTRCRRVDEEVAHPHPSQTRMCRFPASGSSWESLARGGADDTIRDLPAKNDAR